MQYKIEEQNLKKKQKKKESYWLIRLRKDKVPWYIAQAATTLHVLCITKSYRTDFTTKGCLRA